MKNSRTFVMALVVSSTLASGAYAAEKARAVRIFDLLYLTIMR